MFARCLSSLKDERIQASKKLKGPQKIQFEGDKKAFLEDIRKVGPSPFRGGRGCLGWQWGWEDAGGPGGGGRVLPCPGTTVHARTRTAGGEDVANSSSGVSVLLQALYASKIISYAQGFMLLRQAATEFGWTLNYGGIALMWRGGCIIRR